MMLNIHSIFRHTVLALTENSLLMGKFDLGELKKNLIIKIDNIIHNIFINLLDNYPLVPGTGISPRMRDVIAEIDRIEDE